MVPRKRPRRARDDGERKLAQVRWGRIPFWAKDEKIGYKLINAGAEGIAEKPSFREAFKRGRRCLIPADGFYEWAKDTKPKQPWRITLNEGGPGLPRPAAARGEPFASIARRVASRAMRRMLAATRSFHFCNNAVHHINL